MEESSKHTFYYIHFSLWPVIWNIKFSNPVFITEWLIYIHSKTHNLFTFVTSRSRQTFLTPTQYLQVTKFTAGSENSRIKIHATSSYFLNSYTWKWQHMQWKINMRDIPCMRAGVCLCVCVSACVCVCCHILYCSCYPRAFHSYTLTTAIWIVSFDLVILSILHLTTAYDSSIRNNLDSFRP
jgi:hypothetical protein